MNPKELQQHASFLVVDDMDNMLKINKRILHSLGFVDVDVALGGKNAITRLTNRCHSQMGSYDVVLLDWNMPVVHGIDVLRHIRKENATKDTHVLMVTAESSRDNVLLAVQTGVTDYLVKPYSPEMLGAKLTRLCEKGMPDLDMAMKLFLSDIKDGTFFTYEQREKEAKKVHNLFLRCMKFDPRNKRVPVAYLKFLVEAMEFERADELIQYLMEHHPKLPDPHYWSAMLEKARGKKSAAARIIADAYKQWPDHLPLAEAMQSLTSGSGRSASSVA